MTNRPTPDPDTSSTTATPDDEVAMAGGTENDARASQKSSGRRKRLFAILGVVVLLAALRYPAVDQSAFHELRGDLADRRWRHLAIAQAEACGRYEQRALSHCNA